MFIVELILGVVLLSVGACLLTDGATAIAKRLGVSEFLIGVTIVAVGTSMPEFVVSVMSAIGGQSDVSIGNVVGSNIFNIYAILGVTALVSPLPLTRENTRRDLPITLVVSLLLCLIALDSTLLGRESNIISRPDGLLLLAGYAIFLGYMIKGGKNSSTNSAATPAAQPQTIDNNRCTMGKGLLMVAAGLGGLVWGADMFLDGSISLARLVGLSEAVIGIVIVAVGTSLPEFFTTFVSALKGKTDIALGNILGSNIANILLILGTSATITPLRLGGIGERDMLVMVSAVVAVMLAAVCFRRGKIDRIEGATFLAIYIAYTVWLLSK